MSSPTVKEEVHVFPIYDTNIEDSINFNDIIIPFSDVGKSKSPSYIYEGDEKIDFDKRHLAYQKLFLNEFIE